MVNHFHAIYKGNLLHDSDIQIVCCADRKKDLTYDVSACSHNSCILHAERRMSWKLCDIGIILHYTIEVVIQYLIYHL